MNENEPRPHAAKSNEELAALSEWLSHHLQDLGRQYTSIQAELALRSGKEIPIAKVVPPPLPNSADAVLDYRYNTTQVREGLSIGDSYADQARSSAMKITWVSFAIVFALGLIFCALAAVL